MNELSNDEKVNLVSELFKGRDDAYGAGDGMCVKEVVTNEVIKTHLTGKKRIGKYPLSPDIRDGAGTYWLCIDIDEHDTSIVLEALGAIEGLGFTTYLEKSKSKGWHIWIFFSEPVKASDARALGQYLAECVAKEFEGMKVEIFPKQNSLENTPYGNYVNLPLFGLDVKKGKTVFVNPENGFKPFDNQWEVLLNIVKATPEELHDIIASEELETPEEEPAPETEAEVETDDYGDMLPCVPKMMQGVSEGCRDVVAFTLAKHLRTEKKFPQEATLAILQMWNQKNEPSLDNNTISQKIASAYTGRGGKGYRSLGCDDDLIKQFCDKDNCPIFQKQAEKEKSIDSPYFRKYTFIPKRLADELMAEHTFIHATGQIYVYADGVYTPTGKLFIKQRCRMKLGEEARTNRISEVIAHISDMTHTQPEKLNTQTNLINLKNGMYNWIEGKLLPHDQSYFSTIRIPVNYDPSATCPTVDYFFESTLPDDCILIAEELFGYSLIPYVRLEKAFMFTGIGANGKSTFLTLQEKFVGSDNVAKIPLQELDEHRFKRADLYGKLINMFADLDAKALRSSSYFKTIVSGDMIDAERKHRDPFYFRPFARLVYSANEIPQSPDKSFAYYRRWVIIPFPHQFVGSKADKSLAENLTQPGELSGLLNRALKGLNCLFENKDFSEGETVRNAIDDYKRQNDSVAAFITDCCIFNPQEVVERGELYTAYSQYCKSENFNIENRRACYDRVRIYPRVGEKGDGKKRYFTGIGIAQNQS